MDKRADIWAFGCVVYEMLTGTRPHSADTSQETIASILRDEPDLKKVPTQARRLLKRRLEKDPQKRLRHVGDAKALIDEPPSEKHTSAVAETEAIYTDCADEEMGLACCCGRKRSPRGRSSRGLGTMAKPDQHRPGWQC